MASIVRTQLQTWQAALAIWVCVVMVARAQDTVPGVPEPLELERNRARIGRIDIEVQEIFEPEVGGGLYKLANHLHIATRESTVREQLLFRTGDVFERRLLDENERLLRDQRYLNAVSIEAIAYHPDNTVDILVRVQDVWTLNPGLSLSRKGGKNGTKLELEDSNLLGFGKHVAFERSSNVDRTSWRFRYTDANLLGSWWRLGTAIARSDDGFDTSVGVSLPFRTLDSRRSLTIQGSRSRSTQARYDLGQIADRFDVDQGIVDIGGGLSTGLHDGHVLRYLAGYRYQMRRFSSLHRDTEPLPTAAGLPGDRTFSYPWVGAEWVEDRYIEARNFDQIGRTEDVFLGTRVRADAGLAATTFGSSSNALLITAKAQRGLQISEYQHVLGSASVEGRLEDDEIRDALIEAEARYYAREASWATLYGSFYGAKSLRLDPEEQLLLGGDNGLRGYPLRFQAGTARALFTVEQRFYTPWQPLHLFNVGAAVFFDAGRVWGTDPVARPPQGWLKDVGLGLRLGNSRSGLGNVIHVDLAFPLDKVAGRDIDTMQVLIETKRSF